MSDFCVWMIQSPSPTRLSKSLCAHYIGVDSLEQFMVIPQTKLCDSRNNKLTVSSSNRRISVPLTTLCPVDPVPGFTSLSACPVGPVSPLSSSAPAGTETLV